MTNKMRFSVGTSETGSFIKTATLQEAVQEALEWSVDEACLIWALDENENIIETIRDFPRNGDGTVSE